MSSFKHFPRKGLFAIGLAAALALAPAVAEARAGSGSSFGSRGSRTFSAPPVTSTAPRTASPFERSATPQPAPGFSRPAAPASSGLFGGGLGRGFLGGLLGAGLFGLLFGHGLMGGFGGMGSLFGLLLQLALVFFAVRFAMNWFANRQQPAMAGASPRSAYGSGGPQPGPSGFGGFGFGAAPQQPAAQPIELRGDDFQAFERLLGAVQTAYGEENVDRLRTLATPEMVSYFAEEISDNLRKGVVNKLSGVKLLQGDLSEAWREGSDDYATVAMHYSLVDVMIERSSGRVVSGDGTKPVEATELWTFVRPAGAGVDAWKLSAIQQTA